MKLIITVLFSIFILSGCAAKKKVEEPIPVAKPVKLLEGEPIVKFSDNGQIPNSGNRNYRRITRQKMEDESDLGSTAGSMWVMDGQGSYLFTQNKARKEGDILNVRLDGNAQKQVETKVAVIKKLLKQLEDEEIKAKELIIQQQLAEKLAQQQKDNKNQPKNKVAEVPPPPLPVERAPAEESATKEEVKIDAVSTKVVDRQGDGSFRVKGQQPFMIGKREYKVIVTGIVRPEDFNDDGISSAKLLDPQFDVISVRRKE